MWSCNIGDTGGFSIANMLRLNRNITSIYLSLINKVGNKFTQNSVIEMGQAIVDRIKQTSRNLVINSTVVELEAELLNPIYQIFRKSYVELLTPVESLSIRNATAFSNKIKTELNMQYLNLGNKL